MMWKLYYFVLWLAGPCALTIFYALNNVTRAKRARVLLVAPDGQVLLVVNALGDRRWTLPGGGMKRGETPELAARRELAEELRIELAVERFELLGEVPSGSYQAPVLVVRLQAEEIPQLHADKWEIYAHRWHTADQLPVSCQPLVHAALALLSARSELATIQ